MTTSTAETIERFRERAITLPPWLQAHIGRVVSEGRRLAQIHEIDVERVQAGAWGHDLHRADSVDQLLAGATQFGLQPSLEEQTAPILLHGPLAAAEAEQAWGLTDPDILEAIRWHTVARPNLSAVALAVFVADKIEPQKIEANPALLPIRALAQHDLPTAMAALLDQILLAQIANGLVVHPSTAQARTHYLAELARRPAAGNGLAQQEQ